jgi:hypothetical protein
MAIPGNPSARLTLYLKLIMGQRILRFSILKETPTAPQQLQYPPCPVKKVGHNQSIGGRRKRAGRILRGQRS